MSKETRPFRLVYTSITPAETILENQRRHGTTRLAALAALDAIKTAFAALLAQETAAQRR